MSTNAQAGKFAIGEAVENWTGDARFLEYTNAADPIGSGIISPIPAKEFGPELYHAGETRIVTLDLSRELKTDYLATSPSLLAQFMRINAGIPFKRNRMRRVNFTILFQVQGTRK